MVAAGLRPGFEVKFLGLPAQICDAKWLPRVLGRTCLPRGSVRY